MADRSEQAAVLVPAGGNVEIVFLVDSGQCAGVVVGCDLDLDPDLRQRLLDECGEQGDFLVVRNGDQFEIKTDAASPSPVARFVE